MTAPDELAEDVAQALVGDVDPQGIDAFRFARSILPVFGLIRALFSQSELDSTLKLMLLFELARTTGRSTIDRIRALAGFIDAERVDALVRSLKDGGWLELRGADNTYRVSLMGVSLLSVLHGADFGSISATNALARAARTAEFNDRLDGAASGMSVHLDHLSAMLDDEVEEARAILQRGRPLKLIAWSQRKHLQQLDTVRSVLAQLDDRLDGASREFGRLVRLHERMQDLLRMHNGIHARLREWNLERLHGGDSGYSIQELAETVLGLDDEALLGALDAGIIRPLVRAPSLFASELIARFHAARRRLASQAEPFVYQAPEASAAERWTATASTHLELLRARLTAALADRSARDAPLEVDAWTHQDEFAELAWDLATVTLLEAGSTRIALDDGRSAEVTLTVADPGDALGVPSDELVPWLLAHDALRAVSAGAAARITIRVAEDA